MCKAVQLESCFSFLLCSQHHAGHWASGENSVEVFEVVHNISYLKALQRELNIVSQADGELPAGGDV